MGNLFDSFQGGLLNVVNKTFGYSVRWAPSEGGAAQIAECLFKDPSDNQKIADADYEPYGYKMEYLIDVLTGLKESTDAGGAETITIFELGSAYTTGINYYVRKVTTKYDGKTMIAVLEKAE